MCYYPVMVCVWNASTWTPVLRLGRQLVGLLGEDITTLGGILQNKCVTGDGLHTRPASPVYASCSARCEWPTSLSARFYNSLVSQTDPKSQSKPIKHWNPETMSHNELSPCCFSSVFVTKNRKPSYHRLAYSLSSLKCTTHQLCYWSQLCDLFPKRYGERHIQELWESPRRVLCILSCLRREICPQKILVPSAWIRG